MKLRALFMLSILVLAIAASWYSYTAPASWQAVQQHWQVSTTMIAGSFIAGATSEGGGAVAFPVFTKLLHIPTQDAKVFALAIQSVGMTVAGCLILLLRVPVEWRVIAWASLGGLVGVVIGSVWLTAWLPPVMIKMSFTVMVSSFAVTLFLLRRSQQVYYNEYLPLWGWREKTLLLTVGFVGGCMSGLVGNGIDIVCFSVMVLLFRLTEKIATPTSVVLMAINALAGFALHALVIGGFNAAVQSYWLAAVPVVIIGAPLGAYCCTRLSNRVIAGILISLIGFELVSSVLLIPLTTALLAVSLSVFFVSAVIYYRLSCVLRYCPDKSPGH